MIGMLPTLKPEFAQLPVDESLNLVINLEDQLKEDHQQLIPLLSSDRQEDRDEAAELIIRLADQFMDAWQRLIQHQAELDKASDGPLLSSDSVGKG